MRRVSTRAQDAQGTPRILRCTQGHVLVGARSPPKQNLSGWPSALLMSAPPSAMTEVARRKRQWASGL